MTPKPKKSMKRGRPRLPDNRRLDGGRLAAALSALRIDQAELSRRTGMLPQKISQIVRGEKQIFREDLRKIGEAGISADYVLGVVDDLVPPGQPLAVADAVAGRIRQRGKVPSALVDEFVINGDAALDLLAEVAEREILERAEYLRRRQPLVDASAALSREHAQLSSFSAANFIQHLPRGTTPGAERVNAYRRKLARAAIRKSPFNATALEKAVILALNAINGALDAGPGRFVGRIVTTPANVAFSAAGVAAFQDDELRSDLVSTYRRIAKVPPPSHRRKGQPDKGDGRR
jgi:transcriptional regulator with XRE-family HTH domain